ncbi:probable DNA repair/recombination protein Rec2 [Sporisorium reilianum f. sp. reilianum]|uniref:Probable DNA repair/recombination protein Rec2 n=1 Tax=Sporisorium reilianum f. sp. reilianum TaxID=72559 RepID=A0A2N8UEC6_9BASI|nr:probable DNA repair/recombination protein Rec2 [Sporisorium reilianum f. sp. reilianum]
MSSLAIADVPWISKRIKACCRRAKLFSTHEILLSQPQQLQQALRISAADVDLLVLQVATASAPSPVSVLDALNGKLPVKKIDDLTLFDAAADGNDAHSADASDSSSDAGEGGELDDTRFPSSSIVPPTQGYDGNFPGMQRFVYDSDSDSNSDDADAASDVMMHDDVELPSTFRRTQALHIDSGEQQHEEHDSTLDGDTARPTVTRDVLSLGRERHLLSSGAAELDELLGGGFRSAVLTELVGESGSGKTQVAVQACTYAALGFTALAPAADEHDDAVPTAADQDLTEAATLRDILRGLGMTAGNDLPAGLGACYITSAGERGAHSIVTRALELASFAIDERFDRVYSNTNSQGRLDRHVLRARAHEQGREQVLRNLHVACVADVEALEHALKYSLPGLMARLSSRPPQLAVSAPSREIGIVVVDNLPALFQDDPVAGDIDSLVQRSRMLVEIADALKRLAVDGGAVGRGVLVLNHVSDAFGIDKETARRFVLDSADRIRFARAHGRRGSASPGESALPDYPAAMECASQSAFVSGLLASVPPTLAEAIGARAVHEHRADDAPLYTLHARTAQLGHTWSNLVNVRLFLAKTRGRVCMPVALRAASAATQEGEGARQTMATVRKAAVVLNAFGATMLDAGGGGSVRQLRFVITPSRAVHVLGACASAGLRAHTVAEQRPDRASEHAAVPVDAEEEEEEDLFGNALQDGDWLAMDQFVLSQHASTPLL